MNTTLDPKPTDREREMLAEWAVTLSARHGWNAEHSFTGAESLLREYRTRYGVTGAEVEVNRDAQDITLKEAIASIEKEIESIERVYRHGPFANGLRHALNILKGGNNG